MRRRKNVLLPYRPTRHTVMISGNSAMCFNTWDDFLVEWEEYDPVEHIVVRYDIQLQEPEIYDDEPVNDVEYRDGSLSISVYVLNQCEGILQEMWIEQIWKKDMKRITKFLGDALDVVINGLWGDLKK